jgi:hypothetical protein
MNRDSTIFYRSFYEAIKELPEANQLEIYNAIFEHSLNLNKPNLTGLSKTIYTLIEPQIEANLKRYENGNKPKKKHIESETEAKPKQDVSKSEANKNNNKNVNKNDNDNNNEKDNTSLKKKQTPKHLFSESIYIDKHKFKEVLSDWNNDKLKYYYEALITWSNEGNKKIDWIATAKQWASRDEREGKVKFESKSTLPANWMQLKLSEDQKKQLTKQELGKYETHQARLSMQ